jgi:hypothetical protein
MSGSLALKAFSRCYELLRKPRGREGGLAPLFCSVLEAAQSYNFLCSHNKSFVELRRKKNTDITIREMAIVA